MRKDQNLMLMTPIRNEKISWLLKKDGAVQLKIARKGLLFNILKLFYRNLPENIYLDLDEIGSEVWSLCDGRNTVYDIATKLSDKFGTEAEPLYPRLITYLKILRQNGLIHFN
ncbi:PqqD family protein [Thermosediminibacter litoriperuensis]|uniref:Coenzyme PQQ synthesis protein D (PqqD) n=1 Tax=Thermosediminibacter litoriperuensis TaxID=291989 RepID=A0A5S5AH35_9FIRM|nr:PqqD family protein [Thermosediminibacter litoriperuensis]TYP49783.1 coenzyme PQQ synthesis protein D (PqqD) [Thermosediminibacter litoriperuensis]